MKTQAENVIDFDQIKNRKTFRSNDKTKKDKSIKSIFFRNLKFFKKTAGNLFFDTLLSFLSIVEPAIRRMSQASMFLVVLSLVCLFTRSDHKIIFVILSFSLMAVLIIIYTVVMKILSLKTENIKERKK